VLLRVPSEPTGAGRGAEVHHFASRSYEWIVEGDIKACFDEISHSALMVRMRNRVVDRRVLTLVKASLKAGILTEDGTLADTDAGTPQGRFFPVAEQRGSLGPGRAHRPGAGWARGQPV